MPAKETPQRVIDAQKGAAGSGGEVYAAVAALGPALPVSPPPTGLTVTANIMQLSAQAPKARINLLWYPPQAQIVRQYQIQLATDSGFTTGIAYFLASDTTATIDVDTSAAGINYWVRVRVFAEPLVSDWSAAVTFLSAPDTSPAGQPTGLAWEWSGGDLTITWTNPGSANLKDVQVRIWNNTSKTVLLHTGYATNGRYVWALPQQRIDTAGVLDPAVYFELRSRTWSNVLGTDTIPGTNPTNAAPSAPASVALISSVGTLTIVVTATQPSDFLAYRYRIIQTLPSAADYTFDSPSAFESKAVYDQATYQVGVKVVDLYGNLSSETLSSATVIDTLTIGALRADAIYSDSDGNSDATLHVPLSNDVLASGGLTYSTTATWNKFIQVERPLLDRYRTLTLSMAPASGTSSWYVRLSTDESSWVYFAGPVTAGVLTSVANAAAAQAAAVSAATLGGTTTSKVILPSTVEARFVEVWFRNAGPANTTVYEFYPRRAIEADDIYVQNLSAISANMGSITAGTMTGATVQTATSGARIELTSANGLRSYDSGNVLQAQIRTSDGQMYFANGDVRLGSYGMRLIVPTSAYAYSSAYQFYETSGSTVNAALRSYKSAFSNELNLIANAYATCQSDISIESKSGASSAATASMGASGNGGSAVAQLILTGPSSGSNTVLDAIVANADFTGQLTTDGSVAVGAAINSAVRLFVKGIGTSSSTYCFNAQNSAGTNIIYCRDDGLSNFISSAWSSDERHKQGMRPISADDLLRFRLLEPLHYTRTNGPGGSEYGLSAQQSRKIFPEFVTEDENGYLSLRYNDLIPLLMAQVRDLEQRLERVEAA